MSALLTALRDADESYLVGMSNKGLYKRAVKDLETAEGEITSQGETITVTIIGETCTLRDPLWESECSCPSRSICRHILTAILFAQSHLPEDDAVAGTPDAPLPEEAEPEAVSEPEETPAPEPEPAPAPTVPADEVLLTAQNGIALLSELLTRGLVRMPENMAEHLEAAAVQAHAQHMADAERTFRELGGLLGDLRERRAVFRTEYYLQRLTKLSAHLEGVLSGTITELGDFRSTYEPYPGDLKLLAVGEREVTGGEYEGKVYYFLNLDSAAERRFYAFSDLRPVFYDSAPQRRGNVIPWNAGVPMSRLMDSRLTLVNAKVCGGKISSSQETSIAVRTKGNLNCEAVQSMIHTDLRELAVWLSGQDNYEETERLCFFSPKKCLASRFDSHAQQFRMTMEDYAGNHADMRVNFRKETRTFIEELEQIGKTMLEHTEKDYTWLCLASFADGELVLLPLEVCDFITVPAPQPYRLPPQYEAKENARAPEVLAFLDEVESWMCELLQSGIRSAPDGRGKELSGQAQRLGMEGLSGLITTLAGHAESCRHSMHEDASAALATMTQLNRYLRTGRDKLALVCALNAMQTH